MFIRKKRCKHLKKKSVFIKLPGEKNEMHDKKCFESKIVNKNVTIFVHIAYILCRSIYNTEMDKYKL